MQLAQIDFDALFKEQKFDSGGKIVINQSLTLGKIISELLPFLFAGAGLLLLLFLLYGGISLMLSRGDPKAVQGAKDKITGAVVGFVIVFVAYWLVQIIGTILGIEAFKGIFG